MALRLVGRKGPLLTCILCTYLCHLQNLAKIAAGLYNPLSVLVILVSLHIGKSSFGPSHGFSQLKTD